MKDSTETMCIRHRIHLIVLFVQFNFRSSLCLVNFGCAGINKQHLFIDEEYNNMHVAYRNQLCTLFIHQYQIICVIQEVRFTGNRIQDLHRVYKLTLWKRNLVL